VAVSSMAFNLHSAAMQGDSALRWMAAIPIQRWGRIFLAHEWLAHIPTAWKSDAVQQRLHNGMSPAVRFAMEESKTSPPVLLWLIDKGFWPINMLDAAATTFSSAIVYADALSQNMSEEQAMQKMDEAVARFSQPISVTSKSQMAVTQSGPMKMLLMFMADPMLKTGIAMEAIQDARAGNLESAARKLIAVEVWALTSQLIMNAWAHYGGDEDEDDIWQFQHFWRAATLAPFQGFFIAGNLAEGVISALYGEKYFKGGTAISRIAGDAEKAVRHLKDLKDYDFNAPEFWREIDNLAKISTATVGPGWSAAYALPHQATKLTQSK
jgi:hypothetical protein